MTDKLLSLYTQMLLTMSIFPDKSTGRLTQVLGEESEPIMVDGKAVYLPTQNELAQSSADRVIFHPLCENVLRGISEMVTTLRFASMESTNYITAELIDALLDIATSEDMVSDLTSNQVANLKSTIGANATTLKAWRSIKKRISATNSGARIISVFLKSGGEIDGNKYARVAHVSFPLYEALCDPTDGKVFGVKLRKMDVAIFKTMFESIFPNIATKDAYSAGSDSNTAPYLASLLGAHANVMDRLNAPLHQYRKPIGLTGHLISHINLDVLHEWPDDSRLRNCVPPMEYNEGVRTKTSASKEAPVEQPAASTPVQTQPTQAAPPPPPQWNNSPPMWNNNQSQQPMWNNGINQQPSWNQMPTNTWTGNNTGNGGQTNGWASLQPQATQTQQSQNANPFSVVGLMTGNQNVMQTQPQFNMGGQSNPWANSPVGNFGTQQAPSAWWR